MHIVVYILCALTSAACSMLLLRSYKQSGVRLLLWSGLCFLGLALNNVLLIVDVQIGDAADLSIVRTIPALIGISLLLYGFIWDAKN
jgi:hypothetical protein